MVKESEYSARSSVHVAPLAIQKDPSRDSSTASSHHKRNTSSRSSSGARGSTQHLTPPATPNGSQENLNQQMEAPQQTFHNFLRAFYPFNPSYAISDTTVTLPLNEGDVILVHSIHTNGWADGTLLVSGARGWLPTNYCEAYEPDSMRNLLKSLLIFWDLLQSRLNTDNEVFGNQDFIRGIIAGVRYLLEQSNCLTRESPVVQGNETLRRNRKAILSDLSSLVKTAKRLQDYGAINHSPSSVDETNDIIDEMILKAFKIVTRGVRFLDTLEEDVRSRHPLHRTVMATVAEEVYNPPTPPADSTSFDGSQHGDAAHETASRRSSSRSTGSGLSGSQRSDEQTKRRSQSYKRISAAYSSTTSSSRPISFSSQVNVKRQSISHRLSLTPSIPAAQRQNLVSEKLSSSHDTFLSYLGSFIGRLHLQSQTSVDLLQTIRQSVTAGRALLAVVEVVRGHDNQSAESLNKARSAMYDQINKLVVAARDIVNSNGAEEEDIVMPQQNGRLLMAATGCVKAAGECVANTKFVIERIGDFEFENKPQGLGIDVKALGAAPEEATRAPVDTESTPELTRPSPPPLVIPSYEKPLPNVPSSADMASPLFSGIPQLSAQNEAIQTPLATTQSRHSLLPPLPIMTSPLMSQEDYSPSENSSAGIDTEFTRVGSIAASSSGASSSYLSNMRDSEASIISATSTRATTPDLSTFAPRMKQSMVDLSVSGSYSTLVDDLDDGELKMLEKTYANELLYNKEGQITGGTLPALVERLTTHDSTPDAMFVSTFYLTFRLFASPVELAKTLIDRFEYVADSPHIAGPVRLRVYNVFKGWLESHWRDSTDRDALQIIEPFAKERLGKVLPAAGRRVLELAQKVSSTDGPLVPRLISSIGKTFTSLAQYIPADTPLPSAYMSKSQVNALKNWKMGGSNPTILEFDPMELARQLTIKEMNIFCSIMPEELLGSEWTKRSGSKAVNVRAMSTLSTDLSNLVAETILQYDDAKKRAILIKHWIKIAHKCLELNNYDSLMAIICSLNSSTIIRLKKTWDIVSQKRKDMLKGLQAIVEPDRNYAVLRRRLQDHVPPCLPFVGTYLTDLVFVDAGNPAMKQLPSSSSQEGMSVINFNKHAQTAKIIGELQRFQIPYRLTEVADLQEWIQAQIVRVKSCSENENVQQYYRKSLLLEPREHHLHPRMAPSPIEPNSANSRDKFDLFGWTHSSKERQSNVSTAASSSTPATI